LYSVIASITTSKLVISYTVVTPYELIKLAKRIIHRFSNFSKIPMISVKLDGTEPKNAHFYVHAYVRRI
jgi:hypothetical protein